MKATYLGLFAGAVTSMAVIPQVLKSYRTKHVRDISIWQPILLDAGMGLWLAYGIIIGDIPLILANSFSILCNSILISMKIFYSNNDKRKFNDYIKEKCQ
ncbi:MAG TPA: SemiSWEET transporter [Geobacteraceae bacterium]|nr:SemiSWEET transporter [Geobacteraceae bacterium]